MKLNIPPFDGRYVPDIYLTWDLETEQRLTCLQYPEERRVPAAVCAFTSFACAWWSEHCGLYPIPATWAALKTAMRTLWGKIAALKTGGKFCRRILSGITNWHD